MLPYWLLIIWTGREELEIVREGEEIIWQTIFRVILFAIGPRPNNVHDKVPRLFEMLFTSTGRPATLRLTGVRFCNGSVYCECLIDKIPCWWRLLLHHSFITLLFIKCHFWWHSSLDIECNKRCGRQLSHGWMATIKCEVLSEKYLRINGAWQVR